MEVPTVAQHQSAHAPGSLRLLPQSILARLLILVAILAAFGLGYGLGGRQAGNPAGSFQGDQTNNPASSPTSSPRQTTNTSLSAPPVGQQTAPAAATEQAEEFAQPPTVAPSILDTIKQTFYEEAVELIVDWMPTHDLVPLIASFSGVAEDQIWAMQDARGFGKQLAAFVLEDCGPLPLDAPLAQSSLHFANVSHARVPFASASSFARHQLDRVYAHFTLPADYPWDDVLVRWCRAVPLRNYLFGNYAINRGASLNHVWFAPQVAEVGDYYVHIWSIDETPIPLASGRYEVVE